MATDRGDEFYVGYLDPAPPGLSRRMRLVVLALALGTLLVVALVAASQNELPNGTFEFGVYRDFEGVLYERPLPTLRIFAEGETSRPAANLLLVGFGKMGLPAEARGHHGQRVRFKGSLIYRRNMAMIEMNAPDSFETLGPAPPTRDGVQVLGDVLLTGELVDTKCYLGVMRPATGKVHRACAVRCLKGGVPPGLLVVEPNGRSTVFMMTGVDGGPLDFDLEMAARQVEVQGSLELHDELPVLRVARIRLI